jgi:hypothetical protein
MMTVARQTWKKYFDIDFLRRNRPAVFLENISAANEPQ